MKIQGAKKIHYDSGPNLTPMVDIVMVILIFLMLAGGFRTAEHYLVSDVPIQAKGAGAKTVDTSLTPPVTVNISHQGSVYIMKAGNFASVRSSDPRAAAKELAAQLNVQYKKYYDADIKPTDVQIIIYPEQNVTLDALVPAFEAANEAGFTKVGFGVNQK